MALFLTIGYGDQAGYEATDPSVIAAAHDRDAWLIRRGATVGIAGQPIQVRNHDGNSVQTKIGAFLHADLPVAGFALIEAEDIDEAIELVSASPCAVAQGVVEVWPLSTTPR